MQNMAMTFLKDHAGLLLGLAVQLLLALVVIAICCIDLEALKFESAVSERVRLRHGMCNLRAEIARHSRLGGSTKQRFEGFLKVLEIHNTRVVKAAYEHGKN